VITKAERMAAHHAGEKDWTLPMPAVIA